MRIKTPRITYARVEPSALRYLAPPGSHHQQPPAPVALITHFREFSCFFKNKTIVFEATPAEAQEKFTMQVKEKVMSEEQEEFLAVKREAAAQKHAQAMVQAEKQKLPKASTLWHEALVDWILANPDGTWKEAAKVFDVTPEYISMLTRSDAFKMRLVERRKEFDEVMHRKILNKMNRVADKSLDTLLDRLEHKTDFLDEEFLLKAAGKMTEGVRPKADPAPVISPQVSVSVSIPVSADTLNEARKRIKTIEGQKLNLQIEDLSE